MRQTAIRSLFHGGFRRIITLPATESAVTPPLSPVIGGVVCRQPSHTGFIIWIPKLMVVTRFNTGLK